MTRKRWTWIQNVFRSCQKIHPRTYVQRNLTVISSDCRSGSSRVQVPQQLFHGDKNKKEVLNEPGRVSRMGGRRRLNASRFGDSGPAAGLQRVDQKADRGKFMKSILEGQSGVDRVV
uniref:(northern house mosquito) hypothetical protein n=1 Tax=Culex pipiens TaxID=7175 RepID=A0A8D7ZTL2_CULPI